MLKLSEQEILARIAEREIFECEIADGSFSLKIDTYAPVVCVALHAGHRLRSELTAKCALSDSERLYEEDPHTCQMIRGLPITVVANDSRYEYDLNRPLANCIYKKAWGKVVWSKQPSTTERALSIAKHQSFYRVIDALVSALESQFGAALLFDVHSFNYLRRDEPNIPSFNIGTVQLDLDRWRPAIDRVMASLAKIALPNMPVSVAENVVFEGRGYLTSHVVSRFENTLVVPVEIKKFFMDEITGDLYPLVMNALVQQFRDVLVDVSAFFSRRFVRKKRQHTVALLADKMDPAVLKVDKALYQLAKGLETLWYINPVNIPSERKKFFRSHGSYQPNFLYRQLNIDPYQFRERLYRLPVADIHDPAVQTLYRGVVDSLSDKIDLLVKAGKPNFLYESLKYYGEPSLIDKQNAHFILHAREFEAAQSQNVGTPQLIERFKAVSDELGMVCKVETSSKLVAAAMVSNARKAIIIGDDLKMSDIDAWALVHHELGVHMATTLNAHQQKLKVFSLGLPGNTLTQEGLAILNEYQSGNMTLQRLKGLALRVLAVKEMINHGDFRHTFSYLHEEHGLSKNDAFKLSVRVHRGGGFTKDYLYLNGISQALHISQQRDIKNLYVGKTGFAYLDVIDELVERGWVGAPQYYPTFLANPESGSQELSYLMSCIKPSHAEPTKSQSMMGRAA